MSHNLTIAIAAILSLLPLGLLGRGEKTTSLAVLWGGLLVALTGTTAWVAVHLSGNWTGDLSTTLWVTVCASLWVYGFLAIFMDEIWKLRLLLVPYLIFLALIATVWIGLAARPLTGDAPLRWVEVHIVVSVLTYALVTLAAIAAFGAMLQAQALKRKRPNALTRHLPSVADCESLQVKLLLAGELVLALGLMTGVATLYGSSGTYFSLDHKSLLSITAFLVIAGLLFAQFQSGVRGRVAARLVLVAYLLLSLGYPGVKFVSDVLLG
ncbi:cytochrome c biogenesis protein CcsA [Magnetospira thiophila]